MKEYRYTDNNGNVIQFLPLEDKFDDKGNQLYQQIINGILMDNKYNINIIHNLMDNGYKWTTKELLSLQVMTKKHSKLQKIIQSKGG